MGIEARRNIKEENSSDDLDIEDVSKEQDFMGKKDFSNISEEIVKLSELKNKGLLTQEEFEKQNRNYCLKQTLFFRKFGTSSSFSITSSFFPFG